MAAREGHSQISVEPIRSDLENVGNETVRATDVFLVWFTEGSDQRRFLDRNSITVRNSYTSEKRDQAGPVSESQSKSSYGDQCAGIGRVPDITIGTDLDHGLIRVNRNFKREIAAEKGNGI